MGYRVNSVRGTQFRIWATGRLHEYLVKGFAMDDDRLKDAAGGNYFDEWTDAAKRRLAELRSGEVKSIPGEDVFSRVKARFAK